MKKMILFLLAGVLLYSCTPQEAPNTFRDRRDGQVYPTVTIGGQTWMAKNLAYLPKGSVVSGPADGDDLTPLYYVYGFGGGTIDDAIKEDNYKTYGVLYNWPAAMAGAASSDWNPSKVQGVCPKGWHLPSDAEWTQLETYLKDPSIAGGKLKATTHWVSPNTGATNLSGFTALPGGYRGLDGTFFIVGYYGDWWSSTEYSTGYAKDWALDYNNSIVHKYNSSKAYGYSVRCVRD